VSNSNMAPLWKYDVTLVLFQINIIFLSKVTNI